MKNPYKKNFTEQIILCKENHIAPGCVYEMHRHDYIELEIVLSGNGEHIYNNCVTDIGRGHAYIIRPHDYHAFHAVTEVTLLNICFEMDTLSRELRDYLSTIGELYCVLQEDILLTSERLVADIKKEQCENTLLSSTLSRALLYQLIVQIIRLSGHTVTVPSTIPMGALSYVHTNFRKPISLAEMAAALSVSPNYLGRLFKAHTGESFNAYLNEIRLKYACNMLRFSDIQEKKIGLLAGYASNEYFFYAFKKYMKMTPKEYRRYVQRIESKN